MSIALNEYATKAFSEHPIALWSLDDDAYFVSLLDDESKRLFDSGGWSISDNAAVEDFPNLDGVAPSPFPSGVHSKISINNPEEDEILEAVSPKLFEFDNLNSEMKSFCVNLFIYQQSIGIKEYEVGYRYANSEGEEIDVFTKTQGADSSQWINFNFSNAIPSDYLNSYGVKIVLRIRMQAAPGTGQQYSFILNGLSIGQWSEIACYKNLGAEKQDVSFLKFNNISEGVSADQYGLLSENAFYLIENNRLLADNNGLSLVFGSENSTNIIPSSQGDPSFVFPGKDMLYAEGRFKEFTLEMWMLINPNTTQSRRILGPLSNNDGIYVRDSSIALTVGNNTASHNVMHWYRPMIIHLLFKESSVSLLINGEDVISVPFDRETIELPSELNWWGIYSYEDIETFKIDCISIYPYLFPLQLAKKRFVWGQGVETLQFIDSEFKGTTMSVDFSTSNYDAGQVYPDIARWDAGHFNNLSASQVSLSLPEYSLPEINLGGRNLQDWYDANNEINLFEQQERFFTLRPNKTQRFNYMLKPSTESTSWINFGTSDAEISEDESLVGIKSVKIKIEGNDTNISSPRGFDDFLIPEPGIYWVSAYFKVPEGSPIKGQTVEITAEGPWSLDGITILESNPAELNEYQWSRASAKFEIKDNTYLGNFVARISDTVLPGKRDHGISDWYCFENGLATYSIIYDDTTIYEESPGGIVSPIIEASTAQRGTFSCKAGHKYWSNKAIFLTAEGKQHYLVPLSASGYNFVWYASRNFSPGRIYIYSPYADANIKYFNNTPQGVDGVPTQTITVPRKTSSTSLTYTSSGYHFISSDQPIVVSIGGSGDADNTPLNPAEEVVYNRYSGFNRTIVNTAPTSGSSVFYSSIPTMSHTIADGAGLNCAQGLGKSYLSNTYSFGNTLSDYTIVCPNKNKIITSYWDGNKWIIWDIHELTGSELSPITISRSGATGPGVQASNISGTSINMASNATLWRWQGEDVFYLGLNDSQDDEISMYGWMDKVKDRYPDNILYTDAWMVEKTQELRGYFDGDSYSFSDWVGTPAVSVSSMPAWTYEGGDWTEDSYLKFNWGNLFSYAINSFYGIFEINEIISEERPLIHLINGTRKFEINVFEDEVSYKIDNQEPFYTEIINKNEKFVAGLNIEKFYKFFGPDGLSFFANQARMVMYVGGSPLINESKKTFEGKIYKISFLNQTDYSNLLNSSIFNEIDNKWAFTEFFEKEIDAGTPSSLFENTIDGGDSDGPPEEYFNEYGIVELELVQSFQNLYCMYSVIPLFRYNRYFLDIEISGEWEEYYPLSYFATYVKDANLNRYYDLDYLQINFAYDGKKDFISVADEGNPWNYQDLYDEYNVPFSKLYKTLDNEIITNYTTYNSLKNNASVQNVYEFEDSSIKGYLTFQLLSDVGSRPLSAFLNLERLDESRVIVAEETNSPTNQFLSYFTKYEFTDNTLVYPPKAIDFKDVAVVLHLTFNHRGILSTPLNVRDLEIHAKTHNETVPTEIGTKYGSSIYPFTKLGNDFNYKEKNPVGIYVGNTPYLYTTKTSGIRVGNTSVGEKEYGIKIPINQQKTSNINVAAMQFWCKYEFIKFAKNGISLLEIDCVDKTIEIVAVKDFSQDRGIIYAKDKRTGSVYTDIMFYQNGVYVKNPIIKKNEWNSIAVTFLTPLEFNEYSGSINLFAGCTFNNVSYFLPAGLGRITSVITRPWLRVLSDSEINPTRDLIWQDWYVKDQITKRIWKELYLISETSSYLFGPEDIHKSYIGVNKQVVDDNNTFSVSNNYFSHFKDITWSRYIDKPV